MSTHAHRLRCKRLNQSAFGEFIDLICETCHCTHIWPCRDRLSVSIIEFHFPYTQRDTQNSCIHVTREKNTISMLFFVVVIVVAVVSIFHSCFKENALYFNFGSSHSHTHTQLWCMNIFLVLSRIACALQEINSRCELEKMPVLFVGRSPSS